jgi:hypothetical protein
MNCMGAAMAVLTVAHSSGMMARALIAGLAMDLVGLRVAFPLGAAVMLACTLAFLPSCGRRLEAASGAN